MESNGDKQSHPTAAACFHSAPTSGSSTNGATASRTYEVRAGDTLSRIADFVYGDPTLWPRIRDANREKVRDGERVRVGDILVIP